MGLDGLASHALPRGTLRSVPAAIDRLDRQRAEVRLASRYPLLRLCQDCSS